MHDAASPSRRLTRTLACALALLTPAAWAQPAPVQPVTETLHGTSVTDPYRYMEDSADPRARAWMQSQGQTARSTLDRIEGRAALLARLDELNRGQGDRHQGLVRLASGAVFYLLRPAGARQFQLVTRPSLDGAPRVLIDPEDLARRTGTPHAINYFVPSWDGRYVAYGISAGGSEDASLHVMDVRTGEAVGAPIPRVPHGGVSWLPDSRGLAFNQLRALPPGTPDAETYLDPTVRLLRVGEAEAQARAVYGPLATPKLGLSRLDNGRLIFAPDSPWVIAASNDTTQREGPVFVARVADLRSNPVPWKRIARFEDHLVDLQLKGHHLHVRTKAGAPRFEVRRIDLRQPDLQRAEVVAQAPADGLIEGFEIGRDQVITRVRQGATIGLRLHARGDTAGQPVALPFAGAAWLADDAAHAHRDFVYALAGWSQPSAGFLLRPDGVSQPLPQFTTALTSRLPEVEVHDVQVRSHDGVAVPVTLLHRKGLPRDGRNPALVLGYGSYGLTMTAGFRPSDMVWIEQGGVLAVANVRGSGVLGDPWRQAGTRATKPNTWKDGIAVAQYLIDQGYASPATMAVTGGSAGGIFAGRAITEAPQLFAAAVIHVGLLDALRAEFTANGITNISEFGSVKDEAGFKGLLAMSTYHQIRDGTPYPATLFVHGLNDRRVDAWHSAKTAARLQAANPGGKPVLLRLDAQDGHGIGRTASQANAIAADQISFLLWQMGRRTLAPAAQ